MNFVQFVLEHDWEIRIALFISVLVTMALWEVLRPRRALTVSKCMRWRSNLSIVALNTMLLRLIFPLGAVGVAQFGVSSGWGLLNYFQVPFWAALPIAVIALDFAVWLQHVMVHAVPVLWRIHRVHHADLDYDVTTGSRFHPIEIVLSMLIKFATIVLIGPSAIAVLLFELLLNATAMFNHSNVRLPVNIDHLLRWMVVTPDMHRVHHSVDEDETNSNFGFGLPWWDRLLGTYRDQPRSGHKDMTIGIHGYADTQVVSRLLGMLLLPFKGRTDAYAINRPQMSDGRQL